MWAQDTGGGVKEERVCYPVGTSTFEAEIGTPGSLSTLLSPRPSRLEPLQFSETRRRLPSPVCTGSWPAAHKAVSRLGKVEPEPEALLGRPSLCWREAGGSGAGWDAGRPGAIPGPGGGGAAVGGRGGRRAGAERRRGRLQRASERAPLLPPPPPLLGPVPERPGRPAGRGAEASPRPAA